MPVMTKLMNGSFCWSELATSDAAGAKKFYNEVFGWGHHDDPVPGGMEYTMFQQGDSFVGGMYAINEEMKAANVPPHWLNYIAVENVDDMVARAKELGAEVPRPPMDVMDIGRMAVLSDPTGAYFALWQAKKEHGNTLVNEPVSAVWHELMTTDIEKAGSFYTHLLNWGSDVMPMPTGSYTVFKNAEGRTAGGMMAITEEMPPMPPNWTVYMAVENTDETAKKVTAVGGNVIAPPMDIPGIGRMCVFADPQGAVLSVIRLDNPAEPLPE